MLEIESRQARRARERREAAPAKLRAQHPAGNRLARRSKPKDDNEIIIRPTSLSAIQMLKRAGRDYRIRTELRPARGTVHPRTISMYRYNARFRMAVIFAVAAKRATDRRAAKVAA